MLPTTPTKPPSRRPYLYRGPSSGSPLPSPVKTPQREQSPSLAAEEKHRNQLASYKNQRDPKRRGRRDGLLDAPVSGWRRKLSWIEETDEDSSGKSRGLRYALQRKLKKVSLYCLVVAALYVVLRLLLVSDPNATSVQTGRGQKRANGSLPLHQRRGLPTRPALPPAVLLRKTKDHRIANGLLEVDLDSTFHPIYQLIRDAREEWDRKVKKQSKTLKEANDEYIRRYGRRPPKGFDLWWNYVVEHDVPLPDEYDRIHIDLLPFRALSPSTINSRVARASQLPDTYTLKIKHGSLRTFATYGNIQGANERLEGQTDLIRPIAHWLGDLEVVYSVHDTPTNLIGWDHRRELLEHVEDGEYIDADDEIDLTLRGWASSCPPNSPLRSSARYNPPHPDTKSFIASHSALFDICQHPSLVPLHGVLSGKNPATEELNPIFSLSKTHLHADILGVPVEQWVEDGYGASVPWEDKYESSALWRGSNTGAWFDANTSWRFSHRARLMRMATRDEDFGVRILPNPKSVKGRLRDGMVEKGWGETNRDLLDVDFTGDALQCSEEDGTCQQLRDEFGFSEKMTHEDALRYKYVIDVDGNAWSARFKRLLTSGSLVLKSTIMPEWWTDRIQPWVHYVPVQVDYSDLYDTISFFRSEDKIAKDIALSGREWSITSYRREDMTAYVFRLYLEWARLMAPVRRNMDFIYAEAKEHE
ncbi:hypothetical protein P7C73_g4039, partial [Tremellales sp. Uapishka_1]